MKVIIYGIGQGREFVENALKSEHQIAAYVDSFSQITEYRGLPFCRPGYLRNIQYDYIIISVMNRKSALQIMKQLVDDYAVEPGRIIPFSCYASGELYRMKMNTCGAKVDGLIFGNSHALYGYIENCFNGCFVNLSSSSQSLFYNYWIFKRCLAEYKQKLTGLKYVIIDMYDYNFFNSDISLTTGLFDYIEWGGLINPHNFSKNHNYCNSFEAELLREKNIVTNLSMENEKIMAELFGNCSSPKTQIMADSVRSRWNCISGKESLETDKFLGNVVQKRYEETMKENTAIFQEFINEIRSNYPNCKIAVTLIPRYITMEKTLSVFMQNWKLEFEMIIHGAADKFGINYMNFKTLEEISGNRHFYYDICHLNTVGGQALTSILNKKLKYEII